MILGSRGKSFSTLLPRLLLHLLFSFIFIVPSSSLPYGSYIPYHLMTLTGGLLRTVCIVLGVTPHLLKITSKGSKLELPVTLFPPEIIPFRTTNTTICLARYLWHSIFKDQRSQGIFLQCLEVKAVLKSRGLALVWSPPSSLWCFRCSWWVWCWSHSVKVSHSKSSGRRLQQNPYAGNMYLHFKSTKSTIHHQI